MEITSFWDALAPPVREELRRTGAPVVIRPGAFLMREHTRASQVFVLRSGAVRVWVDRHGEIAILDVLGPGDLVGELEAADGGVRHANVEALTRVEALVLPAARFRRVLDAHPGAAWAVAAVLAERLRDSNELRVAHFPDDPGRRLAGGSCGWSPGSAPRPSRTVRTAWPRRPCTSGSPSPSRTSAGGPAWAAARSRSCWPPSRSAAG